MYIRNAGSLVVARCVIHVMQLIASLQHEDIAVVTIPVQAAVLGLAHGKAGPVLHMHEHLERPRHAGHQTYLYTNACRPCIMISCLAIAIIVTLRSIHRVVVDLETTKAGKMFRPSAKHDFGSANG